jgi:5-methylcytosine-specific restriction endonuclease McrA
MNSKTLVLNTEWHPINIIPAWKAVMKVFSGRALFMNPDPESCRLYDFESWVMEWDDAVRSAKIAADQVLPLAGSCLVVPEVIVCTEYRGFGYKVNGDRKPKFSRKNLLLRDRSKCQFCGKKFRSEELTMDHVIPKSKGGIVSWENIVCACVECNHRKADRTPAQAGMKLLR